jgi:hypothetical protein
MSQKKISVRSVAAEKKAGNHSREKSQTDGKNARWRFDL